ncbi:DUF4351 domain-containing protein [Pannus brasiliensis CCIBt3594]|uniref:DUF4351 domain-containing protein n=1 Tax=Pannus brasiliensis CCIBt3594 TaxID=1427578 RepID=A0AAW9QSY8_9CHRO
MTRFIYDQFSKDHLDRFLGPRGLVETSKTISSEIREIDVWFVPNSPESPEELGLLGRFARTPSIFEPYRDPVTRSEILDCLAKLSVMRENLQREANRQKQRLAESDRPRLWILTPTASIATIEGFGGHDNAEWGPGVYFLPRFFRTAIVVIHHLPATPDTLWLRLLGRGKVQRKAIDEVENLSPTHPFRSATLELLYNLRKNLEVATEPVAEDRELIMRLAPLYQEDRQRAIQEGIERGIEQGIERGIRQGELNLVLRLLDRRFGTISESSSRKIRQLPVERLEALGLALLDFQSEADLVRWLDR